MKDEKNRLEDDDFPVVEILSEPQQGSLEFGSLTREEIDAVGASMLFEAVFGKGYIRWTLIFGFAGLTAALLITGFWASTISVTDTLVLYMQDNLRPGAKNAFRLAFIDDAEGFIPLKKAHVALERSDSAGEAVLYSGPLQPGQAASIVFDTPPWTSGSYTMEVEAETLRQKKKAAVPVTLNPDFKGSLYVSSETAMKIQSYPKQLSFFDPVRGVSIELFPESYILASSLHNLVYVRTTDADGKPVSLRVYLELAAGYIHGEIPGFVETDGAGLASFMLYPTFNEMALSVAAADELGEPGTWGNIHLPVEPRIFRLRAKTPSVQAGGDLCVRVYTVSKASPFFLDIYRGGIWSFATSGFLNSFSTEVTLEAPAEPGLATVQGYGAPAMVDRAVSSIHLWIRREGESLESAIASVAAILERERIETDYAAHMKTGELPESTCNPGQLMAFLLSRLDTGHYEPTIFYTTRKNDEKGVSLIRDKLKRIVVVSLSCAAGIFALAVVFAVFIAMRKRPPAVEEYEKEAAGAGAMEEIEDWKGRRVLVQQSPPLEELESRVSLLRTGWGKESGMGTRRFFIQIAMLAAVMAALFGLLAVLITYMRWTFNI